MKKFDNLERFLKNNLDKYAKAPAEDQWDKIWTNVDKGGGSSSLWTAKNIILSSVIVLLTGLSVVLYYNWKQVEEQLTEKSEAYSEKIETINKLKQEATLNELKSEAPNVNTDNSNSNTLANSNEGSDGLKGAAISSSLSETKNNELKKAEPQYTNPKNINSVAQQSLDAKPIQETANFLKNKSNSSIGSNQLTDQVSNQITHQIKNQVPNQVPNNRNTESGNAVNKNEQETKNNNSTTHSNANVAEHNKSIILDKVNTPSESKIELLTNQLSLLEIKLIQLDKFSPTNLLMPSLNATGIKKQNNDIHLTHSFVMGTLISRTKLNYAGPNPKDNNRRNFINDEAIYGTNLFAGYQLSVPIKSKYSISSGLEIRKTTYDLSHKINFKFRDGAPPPKPGQRPVEKDFKYNYNTGSGTVSLDIRSVSDTAMKIEDYEKLELNVEATNTLVNLSLPLIITREFNIKNWNLGIGVGSRFYYELSQKYSLSQVLVNHRSLRCDRGNTFIRKETPNSKFSFDAVVQMTVNYNLGSRFRLGLSPVFEQSLIDNKSTATRNYSTSKLGLMGALQWKF